jgi:E3 Ubiquitin ligase
VIAILEKAVNVCLLLFVPMNRLTLTACFAAVAGLYFFFHGFQVFARKRSLAHPPASTVLTASPGPAAISGMATGPYTLSAPLTGQRCFLYQTTAWQQSASGRRQEWEKVAEETLHLPFFVEDSTGQLLVEPLGAEFDLHQNLREEYGLSLSSGQANIPPRVSVFLARRGIAFGRPIRVEERSLQPDTPVFIAGTVTENPGIQVRPYSPGADDTRRDDLDRATTASSAQPASRPEIIRLSSGPVPSSTTAMTQQAKIAAALTRAGITKPEAWDAAGVPMPSFSAEGVVVEERAQPADEAPESLPVRGADRTRTDHTKSDQRKPAQSPPDAGARFNLSPLLVLMKGAENPFFVISCHAQPELTHSLGWKSVAMVVGGTGLTLLGVYVLLLMQHLRWGR